MRRAQIEDKGAQIGAKGRTRFQPRRRRRLERPGAAWADPAIERHPCDIRTDLRDLDAVVALLGDLPHARDIRPTMRALPRQNLAPSRRVRMQRAVRASMGPALAAAARRRVGLVSLRRRRARIVGGLRGQIELGAQRRVLRFQCRHARHQFLDPRQQRQDQRVLLGRGQRGKIRWQLHCAVTSRSVRLPVKPSRMSYPRYSLIQHQQGVSNCAKLDSDRPR